MNVKVAILCFVFFSIFTKLSGQSNNYSIGEINVTSIGFHKSPGHLSRSADDPGILIYMLMVRENDSVSHLIAQYDNEDGWEFFKLARTRKITFDTKLFDEYVQLLKKINPYKFEDNWNIMDGHRYKISFGDGRWRVEMETNDFINSTENYVHFFNLFNSVWDKFKNNVAQQRL